ncbi:MAG: M48 family metallopeptidase [Clostridia bacterium]|nr:M48 family metallopeptidase [Clostridia bacterium]
MQISYFKADRKSIKIEDTKKGEVRVFYPKNTSITRAQEFVLQKEKWIENKVKQALGNVEKHREVFDLESITLLGKHVKIDFCDIKKAHLTENILLLPEKLKNDEEGLKKAIKQFITRFASELLPQATSFFAEKVGKCPAKVAISHQKSIWGSCNAKKEIRLNAKLVMLPKHLMEYVIVHELCHMIEMNHSDKFWQNVDRFCNSKQCRKDLKEYNFLINLF